MSSPSLSYANHPPPPPIPETEHVVKPKRSVSFKDHPDDHKAQPPQQTAAGLGRRPGKRAGYVRKGPVSSDSEESDRDESEPDHEEEEDEDEDVMRSVVPRRFDDNDSDDEHKARVADIIYPLTQTHITKKTAGPGQNYVRKAPVNSDTESDEESLDPKTTKDLQGSAQVPSGPHIPGSPASQSSASSSKSGTRSFGVGRGSGPGQNYVRKAPVNSDTESDEEQKDKTSFSSGTTKQSESTPVAKPSSSNMLPMISAGRPLSLSLMTSSATSSPIQSRVATPPTSHTPPQQHQQPYYQLPASAAVSAAVSAAMGQIQDPSYSTFLPQHMPMHPPSALGPMPGSPAGLGLLGANSSAASLANSMAVYQQQQAEMMLIMQQQQIQIATMQQQQQAYQLLLLQQQQQQALQQQQAAANRPNEDDSDDDVPLGVHQQQLPQMSQLPQLPQLGSMMGAVQAAGSPISSSVTSSPRQQPIAAFTTPSTAHLSPHLQHSTLAPPVHPYSPLQHSPLLHSRQASGSSVHSIPHASSPLAGKPILSSPHNVYQHMHSNSQPRLQDFIDEERVLQEQQQQQQQSTYPASGGLLTSSFPAGYRHSIGSVSLAQLNLNLDRGSSNSLNSLGSNGSGGGGGGMYGHSPNHSQTHIQAPGINKPARNSMIGPYPPSSSPLLGPYGGMSGVPANIPLIQQHTLIHVEAKPPPPQTGLVGAISAMERDKKLAKAQGSSQQLQQQQLYLQQQQQMQMQDKERWLQEQRRMVMEGGQAQFQQPLYGVPQGQGQRWSSDDDDDDDDDNRPLGSH